MLQSLSCFLHTEIIVIKSNKNMRIKNMQNYTKALLLTAFSGFISLNSVPTPAIPSSGVPVVSTPAGTPVDETKLRERENALNERIVQVDAAIKAEYEKIAQERAAMTPASTPAAPANAMLAPVTPAPAPSVATQGAPVAPAVSVTTAAAPAVPAAPGSATPAPAAPVVPASVPAATVPVASAPAPAVPVAPPVAAPAAQIAPAPVTSAAK